MQGSLWICEREWWDIVCYNPSQYIPNICKRIYRDEPYILKLRTAVNQFCDQLDEAKEKAKSIGCTPWQEVAKGKVAA